MVLRYFIKINKKKKKKKKSFNFGSVFALRFFIFF